MVWFVLNSINKSKSLSGSFRWNAIRAAWNSFHSYFIVFWWLLVREQAVLVSIYKTISMKKERPLILITMPGYFIHFKNINRIKAKVKTATKNHVTYKLFITTMFVFNYNFTSLPFSTYRFINCFNSFPPACTCMTINESIIIGCCKVGVDFQKYSLKI